MLDTTTWQVRIDRLAPGRGAWLCPTAQCFEAAIDRKGLHRSYRREVPTTVLNQLRELWPHKDGSDVRSSTQTDDLSTATPREPEAIEPE